jgi:predicted nucleic acid-binding protein
MFVSNSSPLIHLVRLTKAAALRQLAGTILIPGSVHVEVVERGKEEGYSEAFSVESYEGEGWIRVERLSDDAEDRAREMEKELGSGEAEAVALARQLGYPVLMDDRHGRRVARYHGVKSFTTLGVVLWLYIAGVIDSDEAKVNMERYASESWISSDVLNRFLRRLDEIG